MSDIPCTYSQHYYDFCNTPIHKRPMAWQLSKLAELEHDLKVGDDGNGLHSSADAYQARKDRYWEHRAAMQNSSYSKVNPMGFWHSVMSN